MGPRASTGAGAYTIKINPAYRIGGGTYADVYKIQKKET